MKTFDDIYSELRKKNIGQYYLLFGCIFFSVLLITAYLTMMRSPMVLNVLPEGGDTRKQVMMIFVLAVLGCGVFVVYASNLFFREKSQEIGIFMALGATKKTINKKLKKELFIIILLASVDGILLGMPLAFLIWQLFRIVILDTQEMKFSLSYQSYLLVTIYAIVLGLILFYKLRKFLKRTDIIDIVNESKKSEPIKNIPRYFGILGIVLMVIGGYLGLNISSFIITKFHYYPPEGISLIFYIPAFIGLYMIMLHTVVNGWRRGKSRYNNLVSRSMMKFQGRQTVNNMIVITLLVIAAFFGTFYPSTIMSTGRFIYNTQEVDYSFKYRKDQDMIDREEIFNLADTYGVSIKDYISKEYAILAVDGDEQVEDNKTIGTSYHYEYRERLNAESFLSESIYNELTGENIDIEPGKIATVSGGE